MNGRWLIAVGCLFAPLPLPAQEEDFLHRPQIVSMREQLSGVILTMADQFETDPTFEDGRSRALVMLELSKSMAELGVTLEDRLKGTPEGDAFLEDALVVFKCVGLASVEAKSEQVAMLRLASDLWLLNPEVEFPPDLCDHFEGLG